MTNVSQERSVSETIRNIGVPRGSQTRRGKTWLAPAGNLVRESAIYRYEPNDIAGPRIDGTNLLTCTKPIDTIRGIVRIFPLNHMRVIRNLVPDHTHAYAQHAAVEPWLKAKTPAPPDRERLQSPEERAELDGYYECILCFCCTSGCPSWWWNADRYLGPAALLNAYRWIVESRDESTGERLDALQEPIRLYRCHTILNCTQPCPKGLNPAKAIALIKQKILLRTI